jgi:hypothetical protein
MRQLLLSAAFGAIAVFGAQPASAADMYNNGWSLFSDHEARSCEDPSILADIQQRFRYQVHNVPHLPSVNITDFQGIQETRFFPYDEDHPISRRYCSATAALSDGDRRPIWYLIEDGMGFVGLGDNVEFCVAGFDRWLVYNGSCRVVR